MTKGPSEIDWSQIPSPLSSSLFDKYTHQSLVPPLSSLGIDESAWQDNRSFALNLAQKGFLHPISILYTSFKRSSPSCSSIRSFTRWLTLHEQNSTDFTCQHRQYSSSAANFQSVGELIRLVDTLSISENIVQPPTHVEQFWIFFSISLRVPNHDCQLTPDSVILDEGVARLVVKQKKSSSSRIHCFFAVTPAGRFSNQLILCKQGRGLKLNFESSSFTRIVSSTTGDIHPEHLQQWLDDFLSLSYGAKDSALLIDPRTTLLTADFQRACETSQIELFTLDLNYYLKHVLSPMVAMMEKQLSEANRIDKMFMKSPNDLRRIIYSLWYALRTLKQNEQISQVFHQTFLWRNQDQLYRQALRAPERPIVPKKKKKKSLVKTPSKSKLPTSTMMTDPPSDSTAEQILTLVIQRQLAIGRAGKFLGGMKLDYLRYCLPGKSNSIILTGSQLLQLNTFMQSPSTVDWLRHLRSYYFWLCAKQLFLREIYRLTGIITRKRLMNIFGNANMGAIRNCDLQSSDMFWKAFEEIHQIQLDNESVVDPDRWHDDFHQYLTQHKLDHDQTQLWTLDSFEFPLVKKSTVLQLPEWNELRPMNSTPKVTVLYAFSSTGQSIEPTFIFPSSMSDDTCDFNERHFYNELGHLTPQIFQTWIEKSLIPKAVYPMVLVFCSRLPILSQAALNTLEDAHIYPYGYPCSRTLPFRYLFERRVRNNRSTNLMSELWKKKLLDEQRTHVLKGPSCTVKNIKYYFEQIWSQFLHEKRDDDDEGAGDHHEQKSWEDQCLQAFQQAKIEVKVNRKKIVLEKKPKTSPKKSSRRTDVATINHASVRASGGTDSNGEIVEQLNHLLTVISQVKEQIASANSSPILKMNNHIQTSGDASIQSSISSTETMDDVENVHPPSPSTESIPSSSSSSFLATGDKRSTDENDEPHLSKRLRSSSLPGDQSPATTTTSATMMRWIPPSKQSVTRLQCQSSSLFQFVLSLMPTILSSTEDQLTDEHSRWLHTTVNLYGHQYNAEKINLLIETACKVAKINFVR